MAEEGEEGGEWRGNRGLHIPISLFFSLLFMHIYNSDHIVPALLGACLADASYGNEALRLHIYVV